eukprot:scaffold32845_cov124-Skeletonema_marinoi.AAC.2
MNRKFPKYQRHHAVDDVQLDLVIAACEEGRADVHFDMSPDFHDYDDYDPCNWCGDEMRDYLHLNMDRPNSGADAVDYAEIAAAVDSDAAAVPFH